MRFRALLIFLVLLPSSASAHTSSVSYSHVRLAPGAVEYGVKLSSRDLYEALGLDSDRDATDAEILAGEQRLIDYVKQRIRFTGDDRPCELAPLGVKIIAQTDRFVELRYGVHCPAGSEVVAITYDLFFDLDPRHASRLTLTRGERTITQQDLSRPTPQDPRANRHDWQLGAGVHDEAKGHLDWIAEGMLHIYTGYDHIAFLVGLLLVATLRRRDATPGLAAPPAGGWEARGLRDGVIHLAKIVTAFTIAHSITLIAAALDWLSLPGRFVESAIAASIVYVAVENIMLGDPRHRWPLTFCFGLIHGFGFAGVLRPMLPPSGVVVPLLELNLGVELGQLSIVVLLYPVLHVVARRAGAEAYRRTVVLGGSILVGVFGALWLAERVLEIELISQYLG